MFERKRKTTKGRRMLSFFTAVTMLASPLSAASYTAAETHAGVEEGSSYAFSAESIVAQEDVSGDVTKKIRISRSGSTAEPSEMVLCSYDINADYGADYVLTYQGEQIQKAESITSMYAAFKENRIISDYEEDNNAFVSALLSNAGLSQEGDGTFVPSDEAAKQPEEETSSDVTGLTDADAEGVNFYDSLSTLDKIGAASSRTVISFGAGEETAEITLTVKSDDLVEYDESFLLGIVNPKVDEYLQKHGEGIPDIPLKHGRDIAVTAVTIGDSGQEEPACSVCAQKAEYTIKDGKDKVSVSFTREGATDTFSTVILNKDGEAYGYFYYAPYQEIQEADLEAGTYEILAKRNCTISGGRTITITGQTAAAEKNTEDESAKAEKSAPVSGSSDDLDTVYAYDALPGSSRTNSKKLAGSGNAKGTRPNGNPDWYPDWTDHAGTTETADYISFVNTQYSLFKSSPVSNSHYHNNQYISDKNASHNGKNVYNTWRMNTSGFLSSAYDNVCRAETITTYALTGMESVETRYYVDDTKLNVTMQLQNTTAKQKDYVQSKGIHDIKVTIPAGEKSVKKITLQNDNYSHHDGADVYFMNAIRLNKRTYQIAVENSNKLDYVTKSGDIEQVAAESVRSDQYSYIKMGYNNNIVMNLNMYHNYPMALTGYQLLDKYGNVIKGTYGRNTSGKIRFDNYFLNTYDSYSFTAKRTDSDESYSTFRIQPVVSKIPLDQFKIKNNTGDSLRNPYQGELVMENKSQTLYQGDHVILSAKDVQEGYTFSGVYIRRRKSESADWQYIMQYADNSGRVVFRLDADYSNYEVEPVFSGHEADTVTVTYAEGAREHGSLTAEEDGPSTITLVNPEEYQLNTCVPLTAKPQEGYVTCWYSGNRTYYGDTFYYQMDGNSMHNSIEVDFREKSSLKMANVDLELSIYENQVNLRNSSAFADPVPLADMQFITTAGRVCQGTTDSNGKAVIQGFEGVAGGTYSMLLYQVGENRYRYVEYEFTGNRSCGIRVPAFAGMSAYPDRVTARIDGTSSDQSYIDLTQTGEVEITVEVYRPDEDTKLGAVGLSFYYQGDDGMAKQDYTIERPDQAGEDETSLGVYDTYTLKVPAVEIPNMSYLYVDVKSSYEVIQSQEESSGETVTIDCDTGYVNTGYKFKTPNENTELSVLEDVPDLPGLSAAGEDVSIPIIGSFDFGFTAKNGAYFVRQNDPNTDTFYLLTGYNVVSTWSKTYTDRLTGAQKTADALHDARQKQKAAGDLNGGGSNLIRLPGNTVFNIAPAISLKFTMKNTEEGGYQVLGVDAVIGLDELIAFNMPFSVYGVPFYINITFNGEQFFEIQSGGNNLDKNGMTNAITDPQDDTEVNYFIQAPNLDLTFKTGVGLNAFAGIYVLLGGNLKFNIERTDKWRAGGYFYVKGGVGADLVFLSVEFDVDIPGKDDRSFGDDQARSHIHGASTTLSDPRDAAEKSLASIVNSLNESVDAADKNPVFKVSRNLDSQSSSETENGTLNEVLKPAGKNVKMQLIRLSGKKLMAVTLADNGAPKDSLNYLGAVYAVSEDGGKTWKRKENISKSDRLQWNVNQYKLKDKILLTWSEGDMDKAAGEGLNAGSAFNLAAAARILNAFDLRGRYFDLNGNPLGDSFTIASDQTSALNSLDAVENADGTVDVYYERRAYREDAAALSELMTQEQTICKAVLNDTGKTDTDDKRFLIQSEDGKDNYRITELKAFSHNGIDGQIVVLDADGKLMRQTENGEEASIDDRQIYLRINSDANGNIPAGTLVPLTEAGTCAQHILLLESGEHMYLFWNQEGSIMAMCDFLPATAQEYEEWKKYSGNFGAHMILSDEDALTADTQFRAAINEAGKGIVLWKGSAGRQYSNDRLADQIYAGTFGTDESGHIVSSRGPAALSSLKSEISNLDIQVLDDGQIVYGYTQLDGTSMYESSDADAVVNGIAETPDVRIAQADSEEYPLPGETYTSNVTLWNNGMSDAKDLVLSASGALNGTAPLKDLMDEEAGGNIAAGQVREIGLPVTAAESLKDGDTVTYTLSQNGKEIAAFTDTVHMGAYMALEEMASVISIPGTDDYQISLNVRNKGNQEGTAAVRSYIFDQGIQSEEKDKAARECEYKDDTVIQPGGTAVISYIMKNVPDAGDKIRRIGVQTGDGFEQAVEGMLPEKIKAIAGSVGQPDTPKKGDLVTLGSGNTRADYKVTSTDTVSYEKSKVKVPSGTTSAKVPDTVKISGKEYKVTAIAADAFKGNKKLKKITVGKNVSKIPARAFSGCTALKTVTLGSGLTSIGVRAFAGDKALSKVVIGSKKLNKIGGYAFSGCMKLKSVTIISTKLQKKTVKNSLKGSGIERIKTTSSLQKKYKIYFTKKNAGRTVVLVRI